MSEESDNSPQRAIIIAAGMGSRLWSDIFSGPKTLLPYGKGTVLSTILGGLNNAGIDKFVIVIGYRGNEIRDYIEKQDYLKNKCDFVVNNDWHKGNARSVLAAKDCIGDGRFLLSMSDHLVTAGALSKIAAARSPKNLLLVDKRIDQIFDIPDATKVRCNGQRILGIGKTLNDYNGIDCGIFKFNGRIFGAIEKAIESGNDSISAAAEVLIAEDDFEAVFMDPADRWIDIDTPEAYRYCLENKIV